MLPRIYGQALVHEANPKYGWARLRVYENSWNDDWRSDESKNDQRNKNQNPRKEEISINRRIIKWRSK